MSDFLTNLVQRNARPASLVRPRLPSLFETSAVAAPVAIVTSDESVSAAHIREAQVSSEAPPPGPRAPIRERVDDAEPDAPPSAFAQPAARQEPRAARTDKPADAQHPVAPQIVEHHTEHRTEIRAQTVVTQAPRPVMPRDPVVAKDEPPQPIAPFTAPPEQPRPIAAPFAAPPEQPRPVASPFTAAPVTPRRPPRAESRREARETQRAEADPVIHVSIGRIEVRAVEERETRPRKSDGPSPVMPLDEYLRSRAKR